MRKIIIYLLFFISYTPLFLYLWVTQSNFPKNIYQIKNVIIDYNDLYFLIAILAIILFYYIIISIRNTAPYTVNVTAIEEKNVEYLSYVMTYFFAFLGLEMDSWEKIIWNLLMFLFIAFVYSKSNMIYSNPMLLLLWYNIYQAKLKRWNDIMIISTNNELTGQNIPLTKISDNLYFYNPTKLND